MPNIETILRDHVGLQIECVDRLYLNGYLPNLQTEGQLLRFLLGHRGNPVASPALLGQMTERFVTSVEGFAERLAIPIVHFERGQRKEDVAKERFARFQGDEGVVFIGVAQEKVTAFRSFKEKKPRPGRSRPFFRFYRGSVCPKQFYIYLLDRDFGPCFIKFSTYFSNRMLRGRVAALQGKSSADYSRGQMTYDLRRLRLKGLIQRLEDTHRYVVTPPGRRIALLFAKSHARILRRGLARLDVGPPDDASDPLVKAWHCLDREIDRLIEEANMAA